MPLPGDSLGRSQHVESAEEHSRIEDSEQLGDRDIAMQSRCPHCLGEQWAMTVIAFSRGEHGCTVCGWKTKPMTNEQWYAALAAKRAEERQA